MSRVYEAVRKYIDDVTVELRHAGRGPETRQPDGGVAVLEAGDPAAARRAPAAEPVERLRARRPFDFTVLPTAHVDAGRLARVAHVADPDGPGAGRFRLLRMRLIETLGPKEQRRILVTSALPQEGKSTVALNVAAALAEGGQRSVLLADADFYHAAVSTQLGLRSHPGLAGCLQAGRKPEEAIVRLEPLGCYVLPAGEPAGSPAELAQSGALPALLDALAAEFDWVVIDSPPVGVLADPLAIQKAADGTLLVVRAGRTHSEAVTGAVSLLGRENLLAIVLNAVEGMERLYSEYSRYYRRRL